ncbi:hypothetical protein CDD81_2833 [Ophiocordyceps australis]|uniref:EKC/KEOPS complex subunit BUD32 n=1 Tax=Ophiocordyceps australis TaxID=1399860 RepID=A0A2C5XQP1_9HYPO|nr:hypothetical protein CDD81_2833 [Ophiocordyceps australis]
MAAPRSISPSVTPQPQTPHQFPLPSILENDSSSPPILITQGAEGRLYKTTYLTPDLLCALKHRPSKPWRHPTLDQRLTRHRILSEARILAKCRREGIHVPTLYALDETAGWLMLEWISGPTIRAAINDRLRDATAQAVEQDATLRNLLSRIGAAIGKLHKIGIVHGDLTTSNLMLSLSSPSLVDFNTGTRQDCVSLEGDVVIIDLGLASGSIQDEDRAVDLYVLERAFGSTHPRAECLFDIVLDAYRGSFKQAPIVLKRLQDVRMRGRKRSMLG